MPGPCPPRGAGHWNSWRRGRGAACRRTCPAPPGSLRGPRPGLEGLQQQMQPDPSQGTPRTRLWGATGSRARWRSMPGPHPSLPPARAPRPRPPPRDARCVGMLLLTGLRAPFPTPRAGWGSVPLAAPSAAYLGPGGSWRGRGRAAGELRAPS